MEDIKIEMKTEQEIKDKIKELNELKDKYNKEKNFDVCIEFVKEINVLLWILD